MSRRKIEIKSTGASFSVLQTSSNGSRHLSFEPPSQLCKHFNLESVECLIRLGNNFVKLTLGI